MKPVASISLLQPDQGPPKTRKRVCSRWHLKTLRSWRKTNVETEQAMSEPDEPEATQFSHRKFGESKHDWSAYRRSALQSALPLIADYLPVEKSASDIPALIFRPSYLVEPATLLSTLRTVIVVGTQTPLTCCGCS